MQLWGEAMRSALYGPDGFYAHQEPRAHFRTSVTASPQFAVAIARLAEWIDEALRRPAAFDLVDVGAGDGALVAAVLEEVPADLAGRMRAAVVEVRPRPQGLPDAVHWTSTSPTSITGLVMAHEVLDNVPCDVAERAGDRLQQVLVDHEGRESAGPPVTAEQRRWLDAWWPLERDGDRAECGVERDRFHAGLVSALTRGLALSVDYGHVRAQRAAGVHSAGTLTGYRDGYQVWPVPDGTCDITAHVAIDACAAAGAAAGAQQSRLVTQRDALRWLGVTATLPDAALARSRPTEYVRQLSEASAGAELLDPASLGSFWWLLQSKDVSLPAIGSDALSG